MNVLWGALITLVVTAVAVTAMLLVRRSAPEGSYFADGDRASGVFGVLATGFSVLLGFIVFLAFTSYDESRSGAETEALMVVQQVENAQFFPDDASEELTGQLVCYGRLVVNDEWEQMRSGTLGNKLNPWGIELFRTLRSVEPSTAVEQSAYDKWLDQTSEREAARLDRVHGAVGVIPTQLWIVLFFIAGVIFVYMLFFADRAEGVVTQAVLMGCRRVCDHHAVPAPQRAGQPLRRGRRRARSGRHGAVPAASSTRSSAPWADTCPSRAAPTARR